MVDESVNMGNEEFDYESVRKTYFELCSIAFRKTCCITGPWTIDARNCIISCIKNNNVPIGTLAYDFNADILTKYQIVIEDGDEKLILTGSTIEVLPFEESFDIFLDAHMRTDHGDFSTIKDILMGRYLVYDTCLKLFLLNCNVCKGKVLHTEPTKFNQSVTLEIQTMPYEDCDCKYILFYMDKATTFKLIRPLMKIDVNELSIELFKIFLDFGPPLAIHTMHTRLLNKALSILGLAGFRYKIPIHEIQSNNVECSVLMEYIVSQCETGGANWSTISRLIQHNYNNNDIHSDVLHRRLPNVSPLNQLLSVTNKKKLKISKKHSFDDAYITNQAVEVRSEDEEIDENMDTMDSNIDNCPSSEPGTSNKKVPSNLIDNLILKHEISIEETIIANTSNQNDPQTANNSQTEATLSEDLYFTLNTPQMEKIEKVTGKKFCSYCKGTMFTDYFCAQCKKLTHIFCLSRTAKSSNRENETIVTYLCCHLCKKLPFHHVK